MIRNGTRDMETWSKPIAIRGEVKGRKWWKEGGRLTQRTGMNDWWAMERGSSVSKQWAGWRRTKAKKKKIVTRQL